MKYLLLTFITAALIACSSESGGRSLEGTFVLNDLMPGLDRGDACSGDGGYSDIRNGTQVTVRDEDGTLLATGELTNSSYTGLACEFSFLIADLPSVSFYVVEVANRGEIAYSAAELEEAGWAVRLQLGN